MRQTKIKIADKIAHKGSQIMMIVNRTAHKDSRMRWTISNKAIIMMIKSFTPLNQVD